MSSLHCLDYYLFLLVLNLFISLISFLLNLQFLLHIKYDLNSFLVTLRDFLFKFQFARTEQKKKPLPWPTAPQAYIIECPRRPKRPQLISQTLTSAGKLSPVHCSNGSYPSLPAKFTDPVCVLAEREVTKSTHTSIRCWVIALSTSCQPDKLSKMQSTYFLSLQLLGNFTRKMIPYILECKTRFSFLYPGSEPIKIMLQWPFGENEAINRTFFVPKRVSF